MATGFKISSAPDSIVRITIRRINTIGNLLWKTNLAKSFVIFDEAVEIIRDTKKALKKLETIIPVSELHRLSLRVDNFLSNLDE